MPHLLQLNITLTHKKYNQFDQFPSKAIIQGAPTCRNSLLIQKINENVFRSAFGVRSTQTVVKIYIINVKCLYSTWLL